MTSEVSIEDRYNAALTDVRLHSDVLVFDNYPMCCGSCAGTEIEQNHPDGNYVYFMNSQGRGLTWVDGKPWNYEDTDEKEPDHPAKAVYFSHSNLHSAQILHDAFVRFGLPVEWNGTDGRCVVLNFQA
jgi:hypothetical protein